MNDFMIFVAPFLTVLISLFFAFYVATKDKVLKEKERKG